jgi:hypothetical protein
MTRLKVFLLVEAVIFATAALAHAGILLIGYEDGKAAAAEGVIAAVLIAALCAAQLRPGWTRMLALFAQGFALLGTLVGVAMIVIGVGPQSAPDAILHIVLSLILAWGFFIALRRDPQITIRSDRIDLT